MTPLATARASCQQTHGWLQRNCGKGQRTSGFTLECGFYLQVLSLHDDAPSSQQTSDMGRTSMLSCASLGLRRAGRVLRGAQMASGMSPGTCPWCFLPPQEE